MKVPIRKIKVDTTKTLAGRARADFGDLSKLAQSIKDHGFIHSILVDKLEPPDGDKEYILICGERRLRAAVLAGLGEIDVKLKTDTTEMERKAMELEENVIRKDLSWLEEAECLHQLHDLRQQQYGAATHSKSNVGWGTRQTAEAVGRSLGSVGDDLKLVDNLRKHPELVKRASQLPKVAAKKYVNQKIDAMRLRELVDAGDIEIQVDLRHGDCCELIDELADRSVDCLLTDPPFAALGIVKVGITGTASFGVNESNVSTMETMIPLYERLMPKLAKKLKIGAHVYIFCGMGDCYTLLMSILAKNGFLMDSLPLIWDKGRTSVVAKDYHYVSSYESLLFGHNQERNRSLWKPVANIFHVPAIAPQSRVHPLQRPDELLRKLIENSTSVGELVLDCFAGSGSTLMTARDLQRRAIGFELDEGNYLRATKWLSTINQNH